MFCSNCGKEIPEGYDVCMYCGTPLSTAEETVSAAPAEAMYDYTADYQVPVAAADPSITNVKQYVKNLCSKKCKNSFTWIIVVLFVLSGINLIVQVAGGNYFGLLDVAIFLGLTIWFTCTYSKASAIVLLVFGALECILSTIAMGQFAGFFWPLLGICALTSAISAKKSFDNYRATGTLDAYALN